MMAIGKLIMPHLEPEQIGATGIAIRCSVASVRRTFRPPGGPWRAKIADIKVLETIKEGTNVYKVQ